MANNINVNLSFTADTSKAQQQLQSLQQSLNNITNSTSIGGKLGRTDKIQEGIRAAAELQVHLQKAVNTDTGNLDFSKLSQSLKQSGTSLQQYGNKLQQLGPTGQQAFQQLAQAVAQSEIPLRRTNALLENMGRTLANTIKWQISSSLIHGFMGSIQKAYGYAQDLNESLNNIRIVTGYDTDQMAKFAKEANKAAKTLSTTTTAYTDASLIFYQQGLSDQEVLKRTDVVVKMANVTKQSVEETSNQLTAIWNNFDDGTKSLEYYADVLTKLGAATASSTDEIAGGLEKFAAIGETIGLSYEYAAAALATITAKTRQSEEVVGTALKTIFARIQGLKLGESLEDGTDLNKYSQALATVGISIFQQNGELKEMDDILDEMGAKWQTLSKDQQTALAQTVAGVRQYNQVMSLMNNWDFMQQNVDTAMSATGELTKQHEIYEEGWEAASKRVQAALEEMYSKFINDDFFIELTNGFKNFIELINKVIDSAGGLKGILMGIGAIVTRIFSNQMASGIVNMVNGLKLLTKSGQETLATERAMVIKNAINVANPYGDKGTGIEKARAQALQNELGLSEILRQNADRMSDIEIERNKILLDRQRVLDQEIIKEREKIDLLEQEIGYKKDSFIAGIHDASGQKISYSAIQDDMDARWKKVSGNVQVESKAAKIRKFASDSSFDTSTAEGQKNIELLRQKLQELKKIADDAGITLDKTLEPFLKDVSEATKKTNNFIEALANTEGKARNDKRAAVGNIKKKVRGKKQGKAAQALDEEVDAVVADIERATKANQALDEKQKKSQESLENLSKTFGDTGRTIQHWSNGLISVSNSVMSLSMAFSSLYNAWNVLNNPDMSGWEKFISIAMSLGMAIPSLISGIVGIKGLIGGLTSDYIKAAHAQALVLGMTKATTEAEKKEHMQKILNILALKTETDQKKKDMLVDALDITQDQAKLMLDNQELLLMGKSIAGKGILAAMTKSLTVAKTGETSAVMANTVAWYANPIMWIAAALALVVVAIVAITAAIQAQSKAIQEQANKTKEAMEKFNESVETTKKLKEETNDLIDTFAAGISKGEDMVDTYSDLNIKLLQVANSYKQLGVSDVTLQLLEQTSQLGMTTNNWQAYRDAIVQADKEVNKITGKKQAATSLAQLEAAKDKFKSGDGKISTSMIKGKAIGVRHIGDLFADPEANNALALFSQSDKYSSIFNYSTSASTGGYAGELKLDFSTDATFLRDFALYEEMRQDILLDKKASQSDAFREMEKEYEALKEYAESIKGFWTEAEQYHIEEALSTLQLSDPSEIKDINQYIYYIQAMSEELKEVYGSAELAAEGVQKYLNTFSNNKNLASQYNFLERFANKTRIKVRESHQLNIISGLPEDFGPIINTIWTSEHQEMFEKEMEQLNTFYSSLGEEDRTLLFNIELDYIDSVDKLKTALEELKEFDVKVKFKYEDQKGKLKNASSIRSEFDSIMQAYKKQGYLTITDTMEFIQENPEYIGYFTKTANGYALTTEAINDYNQALQDAENALDNMISIENIGKQEVYEFGVSLVGLSNVFFEKGEAYTFFKNFSSQLNDLNADFLNGKINQEEYFNSLQSNIDNIDFSTLSGNDLEEFQNKVLPTLLSGINSWVNAYANAFNQGKIDAKTLSNTYIKAAKTAATTLQKTKQRYQFNKVYDAIIYNPDKSINKDYKDKDKYKDSNDDTKRKLDNYYRLAVAEQNLIKNVEAAEGLQGVINIGEQYYETLTKLYNNDWTIKINNDALKESRNELVALGQDLSKSFDGIGENAKKAAKDVVTEFIDAQYSSNKAIRDAAMGIIDGNINYAEYTEQELAKADAAVLASSAQTIGTLGNQLGDVLTALETYLGSFSGNVIIKPVKGTHIWDIFNPKKGGYALELSTTGFTSDPGAKQNLADEIAKIQTTTDFYKGTSSAGTPGDIDLDEIDNGGNGGNKDKTQKSDIVERYKPINAKLEKQGELLNEINDLQDKLYGTDRLDNIDRYINSLEKENELLAEKEKLNKQYTKEDYNALQAFAKKEGLTLKFDTDGNLENETAIQEAYWKKIKSIEDSGGDSEKIKEKVNEFKSLTEAYAESLEIASEILQEQIDNFYEAIEKAQEKYDIQLELFEKDAEKAEKKVNKSYGMERIKAEQSLRAEYQKSTDYINKQALPQTFGARKGIIDQLKKYYGIEVDTNTMTAINENDVIAKWTKIKDDTSKSMEERQQANEVLDMINMLLGGLGVWNQKVEELYDSQEENYEKINDSLWSEFDYEVELKGIITELEIQKIDLKEVFIDENAFSEKIALDLEKYAVNNQQTKDALNTYNKIMQTPLSSRNEEWYNRAREAVTALSEAIIENQQALLEQFETYKEIYSEIHDMAMEAVDDYGRVAENLEHYQNLVETLNGETDYQAIESIQKANLNNTKEKLKTLTNYLNSVIIPQRDQLAQEIASGLYSGDALEKAKEELKVLEDLAAETSGEINSTLEESIEIANQLLENGINKAIATFEEAITGGFSLEELVETIERLTKKQEEYLTKTNQLYETNKIIRKAQLEMDKTDNLIAKQKYQAYIKEVEQLAAAGKMSQQDLKIAQARYELLQAQIALEEAQKAKDSMRLVRGSDGNWDYVYTADQSKITDAEGKVANAENSLYNLGLEGAQNYRDKIIQLDQEFNEKTREINEKYKNDEEARQKALDELLQHHLIVRQGYEEEYYKAYNLLTSESATGYVDYMLGQIASTQEFEQKALELYGNINVVVQEWLTNTTDANNKIFSDYSALNSALEGVYSQTSNISEQVNNTLIPSLTEEAKAVREAANAWLNLYNNAKKANEELANKANAASDRLKPSQNNKKKDKNDEEQVNETFGSNLNQNDLSGEMLKAAINNDPKTYQLASILRQSKVSQTKNDYGYTTQQIDNIIQGLIKAGFNLNNLVGTSVSSWAQAAKENGVKFDTGGYTGTWGPDGKFAMLHQKELILNSQDTENVLAAVDIVRQLSKDLDLRASAYANALNQIKAITNLSPNKDILQQEVNIQASFPAVSSRDEIEAAFNNLVNDAVQYINME